MSTHCLCPELDNPVYHIATKLRGYTNKTTVFQATTDGDAATVLKRLGKSWTKEEHERLAAQHGEAAERLKADWNRLADEAAMETFGRPFAFGDYRISGIGREEFSDDFKTKLRFAAHAATHHGTLHRAHDRASRRR